MVNLKYARKYVAIKAGNTRLNMPDTIQWLSVILLVFLFNNASTEAFSSQFYHRQQYQFDGLLICSNGRPFSRGALISSRKSFSRLNMALKKDSAFDNAQKLESVKSAVVGALAGGVALTPLALLHDTVFGEYAGIVNGAAQWEFDTDMGSLQAALFAIVYRYCIREDENPMLNQGIIGAFVLVRVLSKIRVPSYCSYAPLDCGEPLGYFDWNMLSQAGWAGVESAALFGVAALAMDYCFSRDIISKFRS